MYENILTRISKSRIFIKSDLSLWNSILGFECLKLSVVVKDL